MDRPQKLIVMLVHHRNNHGDDSMWPIDLGI